MRNWLRHFLPYGVVRARQIANQLARLGISPHRSRRLALRPDIGQMLIRSNLHLLPDGALANLEWVIDVGANAGDWTADLLTLCQPARVVLVEPDPRMAEGLRQRFAGMALVEIVETALGSAEGSAELHIMTASVFNSFRLPDVRLAQMYGQSSRVKETVNVTVRTVDSLAGGIPRVSLLKIDVQGSEREVLSGAEQTLRKTDLIILEVNFQPHYEGEAGFLELDGILQHHGFRIGNYSAPKGTSHEAFYADALYVRRDR